MKTQITVIRKAGHGAVMSKRIYLDEDGTPKSDGSQCLMIEGTATRASAETAAALAKIIFDCDANQAIALGKLKEGLRSPSTITTKTRLKNNPGAISRSREYINYCRGEPGWALIDFDKKGMPASVASKIEAAGGMWNALVSVVPGLSKAARVSRGSTSAGLFRTDTGEQFLCNGGDHHYVLVKDADDIGRCLHDLHDWCWSQGLGWYVIGASGQLLERSLVDRTVGCGERLCFEGPPTIELPLGQDMSKRNPEVFEGTAIDSEIVIPRLTEYQRQLVQEAKRSNAEPLAKKAGEIRTRSDKALAEKISAKSGMPAVTALRLVSARHRGFLLPYLELDFDHEASVSVSEVLADPERFVGETLADPLEGVAYGRCKAMVMKGDDGRLFIHSFAHGRGIYYLRHDARSAKAALDQAPVNGVVDYAMDILAMAELEADELDDFVQTVAKTAKVSKTAVKKRICTERRKREETKQKSAATSGADGRLNRPRPEPDGELTPTVTFLDDTLSADTSEEPPMRDASGKLVEVRVREPWNLHLLTADGTNGRASEVEALQAPAEPGLEQLTSTCTEMLIERYVSWEVSRKNGSYFGATPKPYVDALMQYSPSAIPIARAINTSPLVAISGNVIDGVGLDRFTGLVHRIDPALRACLPLSQPTDQDVRDALSFLMGEWFVDVSLDPVGKCVAIMLALTLIERVLLTERPAFFLTAGQRGGGKTTLASMITLAVLGRRAAAASWSTNAEERKKALFSYLRQGVACLCWDNIPRGESISCPHIEAALTAAEASDRVLGASRTETVSSTTIHVLTGNSITPRGDMASRSFMIVLNVDRPDPENRPFAHSDPLAWTQANRQKIMRALYTLLVAGALNRPKRLEAKTRFKTWWMLVGWPTEYAAALLGIKMDCNELLRAGEAGDEEASATSKALTVLREIFAARAFAAKEVVAAMTNQMLHSANTESPERKAIAETLSDALGELVGKTLDRVTAHSIGKLFQKRLVGRAAFFEDGKTVGKLVKAAGHSNNTYRVEVQSQGRVYDAPPTTSGTGPKQSPHSPHSPSVRSEEDVSENAEGQEIISFVLPEDGSDLV